MEDEHRVVESIATKHGKRLRRTLPAPVSILASVDR
jgi:hypothetical protein